MTKDLINRLRDCHATTHTRSLIDEAADALERLTTTTVELPEPNVEIISGHREPFTFYDADQLRDYGDRRAAAMVRGPLTEEQIIDMNDDACEKYITQDGSGMALARAIEAAHGIGKGEGV